MIEENIAKCCSVTVQRDESTGGRCILVEPLRDALGQVLSETDAQVRGLKRTKWRLGVWPVHGGDKLDSSVWRLLDTKLGLAEMPLYVTSNNGSAILAVSPNVSLDWLKVRALDSQCAVTNRAGCTKNSLLLTLENQVWVDCKHQAPANTCGCMLG